MAVSDWEGWKDAERPRSWRRTVGAQGIWAGMNRMLDISVKSRPSLLCERCMLTMGGFMLLNHQLSWAGARQTWVQLSTLLSPCCVWVRVYFLAFVEKSLISLHKKRIIWSASEGTCEKKKKWRNKHRDLAWCEARWKLSVGACGASLTLVTLTLQLRRTSLTQWSDR